MKGPHDNKIFLRNLGKVGRSWKLNLHNKIMKDAAFKSQCTGKKAFGHICDILEILPGIFVNGAF